MKKSLLIYVVLLLGLLACSNNDNSADGGNEPSSSSGNSSSSSLNAGNPPATVSFFNESSYKVYVYKNLNPDYFDPTTLVDSINPGSTRKVTLYASADQIVGDIFYPRYRVLLADRFETGTSDIYVETRRNLSNITFVVESGKSYTKTIPQPLTGELKFVNGYITVKNERATQIRMQKGSEILQKLDDSSIWLLPGSQGYYEIPISMLDETLEIDQLKAFSSNYADFPAFVMERGKLYYFTVNNTTVTGPVIESLKVKN